MIIWFVLRNNKLAKYQFLITTKPMRFSRYAGYFIGKERKGVTGLKNPKNDLSDSYLTLISERRKKERRKKEERKKEERKKEGRKVS